MNVSVSDRIDVWLDTPYGIVTLDRLNNPCGADTQTARIIERLFKIIIFFRMIRGSTKNDQ